MVDRCPVVGNIAGAQETHAHQAASPSPDARAAVLEMTPAAYQRSLIEADCARAGLWLPHPESVQIPGTPLPVDVEKED